MELAVEGATKETSTDRLCQTPQGLTAGEASSSAAQPEIRPKGVGMAAAETAAAAAVAAGAVAAGAQRTA